MASNWRPRNALEMETNLRPGWRTMHDRGRLIGHLQRVTMHGRTVYRGWDPEEIWILGYALTLDEAATQLWEWGHRPARLLDRE